MSRAAAKTGAEPAALVAIEQFYPENMRILSDPLEYRFLPRGKRFLVSMLRSDLLRKWMVSAADKYAPGLWGGMLCRKRYIDEKLTDTVGEFKQIVNWARGWIRAYLQSVSLCIFISRSPTILLSVK